MANLHHADAALDIAAAHHDRGLKFMCAVAGEDGAIAGIEQRVFLEERHGIGGYVESGCMRLLEVQMGAMQNG